MTNKHITKDTAKTVITIIVAIGTALLGFLSDNKNN